MSLIYDVVRYIKKDGEEERKCEGNMVVFGCSGKCMSCMIPTGYSDSAKLESEVCKITESRMITRDLLCDGDGNLCYPLTWTEASKCECKDSSTSQI